MIESEARELGSELRAALQADAACERRLGAACIVDQCRGDRQGTDDTRKIAQADADLLCWRAGPV